MGGREWLGWVGWRGEGAKLDRQRQMYGWTRRLYVLLIVVEVVIVVAVSIVVVVWGPLF